MNTKFQSQILAAVLLLASTSVSLQPTFAADQLVKTTFSASSKSVVSNDIKLWVTVSDMLDQNKRDEALAVVNQALQDNENNATAHVLKAIVVFETNHDTITAISELSTAIALDPKYSDALYIRGVIYKDAGDTKKAEADFDTCIALDNHDCQAMGQSLSIKYANKDWNGMLNVLNIEIANNPVGGNAYFNRAFVEYQLGQKDAAIADLKQAQTLFMAANDTEDAQAVANALSDIQNNV